MPQQIAGGDIYPALEKGTIDAAEWVGPYDDQKLGFNKIAPYYYYPGWWEGGPQRSRLDRPRQVERAAQELPGDRARRPAPTRSSWMLAKYDAENPKALRELVAGGTKLLPFSQPVMEACVQRGQRGLCRDHRRRTPSSRRSTIRLAAFRNEEVLWFRVAENTFDNFMARQSAADKL